MKITACKQQVRNPERISIFVDGKYVVSLTTSQFIEEKLRVGHELDDQALAVLKKKSSDGKLRVKAMNWTLLRPRSQKELADYLKRTSYPTKRTGERTAVSAETSQLIIDDFVRRGWVDDEVFARWWVDRSSRRNKSVSFLKSELMSKGIDRELISLVLGEKDDTDVLVGLVKSLGRKTKYKDTDKLIRYLVGKGFRYSSVKEALAEVAEDNDG